MVIVVMMIVVVGLGHKLLWRHFAAMAGAALHRYARVLHHADVILVDVLGHLYQHIYWLANRFQVHVRPLPSKLHHSRLPRIKATSLQIIKEKTLRHYSSSLPRNYECYLRVISARVS